MAEDKTTSDGAEFVAYRNVNTKTIHLYDEPNADLEARSNFERVELTAVPASLIEQARTERANRRSIAQAGVARAKRTGAVVDETTPAEPVEVSGAMAPTPPTRRTGAGDPNGVLSRPGVDDVQIGPNPELHPRTDAELSAQAQLDAEVPQNVGVLAKQHALAAGDTSVVHATEDVAAAAATAATAVVEQVPAQASAVAARLAPGTSVPEVQVKGDEPGLATKRAGRKATPAKKATGGTSTGTDG
jgi:hypothetical protein